MEVLCSLIVISAIVLMLRLLYKFIFDEPTLKKFNYPYKEPGVGYLLRYYVSRVWLSLTNTRIQRVNTHSPHGRNAVECGIIPTALQTSLELQQPATSNNRMDELRIMGANVKTGEVLDVRLSREAMKTGASGRCWVYMVTNDTTGGKRKCYETTNIRWIDMKDDPEGQRWHANDLIIWCMEPMMKWRLLFNGFLRDVISGEVDQVKFSLIWAPYSAALDHAECATNQVLADALAKSSGNFLSKQSISPILNQYDQWGMFYGNMTINNQEETKTVLRGVKTRHIGNFNWLDVYRYMTIKLYFDDGTVASINTISLVSDTLPELIWGYVELCGNVTDKITSTDYKFPMMQSFKELPSQFSFRLTTDGEEYIINLETDAEGSTNEWGQGSKKCIDIKVNRVRATMINITQHLVRQGVGIVQYGVGKEIPVEDTALREDMMVRQANITEKSIKDKDVLKFTDVACTDSNLTGGKGSSLAMLTSLSKDRFTVPVGFCIAKAAFQRHIDANIPIKEAINKITQVCCGKVNGSIQEESGKLEKLFLDSKLSPALESNILLTLKELFGPSYDSKRFAVRSSAIGEDGEEMSAAGQMETYLGCKDIKHICDAVVKCWSSVYGFRAVEYRRQNGQIIDVGMTVVVQEMVDSDVAGVMFTRDPITGYSGIINISANAGLGESVVSGTCEPDTINITRTYDDHVSIKEIIKGKKQLKIIMSEDSGIKTIEDIKDNNTCCLTNEQALELSKIGIYVEHCYGNPCDIEWALFKGHPYLLQCRPITSFEQMSDLEFINEFNSPLMTDNDQLSSGNIKEVMPGAMSPIWNTFISDIFDIPLQRSGYGLQKPRKPNSLKNSWMAQYRWHRFANRTKMAYSMNMKNESMKNIHERNGFDIAINGRVIEDEFAKRIGIERYRYNSLHTSLRNKLGTMMFIMFNKTNINEMHKKYDNLNFHYSEYKTAHELANKLFDNTEPLIDALHMHVKATLSSAIMNGLVLIELMKGKTEVSEEQYGDFAKLMSIDSNSDEIESANVPAALNKLAAVIEKEIKREEFSAMSNQEAVNWLESSPEQVQKAYRVFITKHGHRCIKEFDIASKTWSMEPKQIIDPLKAIIKSKNVAKNSKLNIDEALQNLKTDLSFKQKNKLKGYVLDARQFVAYREQAKSLLIRTVHQYRLQFVRLGEMMVSEGRVPDAELITFMSHIEILQLLKTRSPAFIQRATRRRRLHAKLDKEKYPELNYGFPKAIEKITYRPPADGTVVIEGTPVSRGIVDAPARVVTHIEEAGSIQPGEILVTHATDIAWSPYFPSLSGVITELGGLISHGAVVAREYGIPCVVGAEDATVMLKSGNIIRLNGKTGRIEKLKD